MSMMDYQNPGSAHVADHHSDVCQRVLTEMLNEWPEVPDENLSPGLLDHVCHCQTCLVHLIAVEAAIELADLASEKDQF